MAARRCGWSSPALGKIKMRTTRVRLTDGGSLSAIWSVLLEGWNDHENEIHRLLDNDRTLSVFYVRRCRADNAISGSPSRRGARAWLSNVLLPHPWGLEGAWSHCHTRAGFSAAQGMGVCRDLL